MTPEYTTETVKADLGEAIRDITGRYPTSRSAIMPALYLAQDKYGAVDEVIYRAIAEILDVPEIWVFEVASFYTMYNREKVGRFHLQLCTNVSCMLRGAYDALGHLERRLGVGDGQTTADGLFTLSTVECIGSCDYAPVLMVNDRYHHNITAQGLDALLDRLAASAKETAS